MEKISKVFKRRIWRKLSRKLIVIICITVIPINILAILLSGIAVKESKKKDSGLLRKRISYFYE